MTLIGRFTGRLGVVLAVVLCFAGAGGARAEKFFCYVSVGAENRIAVYEMTPLIGTLSLAHRVELDGSPGALCVSPDRKFLYASIRSKDSVAAFRINPKTGGLDPLGMTPIAGNAAYVATDRSGKFLLSAYYADSKAAIHPIRADGSVSPKANQVLDTGKQAHSIQADPSNRFVFVPCKNGDVVEQFKWDAASGMVTTNSPARLEVEVGDGPRHFYFHPAKPWVYIVNESGSSVTACNFDRERGTLAPFQKITTLPAGYAGRNTCADVEITPNGKFLYASNRGHDSLAGFKIDPETGRLTAIGQFPTEKTPREFNIGPQGYFLYAAGQGTDKLAAYRINQKSGALERFATHTVGKGPAWVMVVRMPE